MLTAYSPLLPPKNIPVNVYPNNEPIIRNEDVPDRFNTLLIRPNTFTEFMAALFLVESRQYHDVQHLIVPLIPGARQDRKMYGPTSDALLTLQSVGKLLDATGCQIHTLDPHSSKTEDHVENITIYEIPEIIVGQDFSHVTSVIAPDKGAKLRAGRIANLLGVPLVTFSKVRDTNTGNITSYDIDVEAQGWNKIAEGNLHSYRQSEWAKVGKFPLVVDDICDGGATFIILAKSLKEMNSSVSPTLFVTHGLFTRGHKALTNYYTQIITTDSIYGNDPNEQVKVIPFCDYLARSICA